ncbi:MAG TPA: uroporphyrinogen decarboxylase [Planctomycetes bacterium]|nr:uroporphyrinogen decarboxylase [Planctomycetota bacterium]
MTTKKRLLAALAREPLDRPPVWLMRQAGRYLPEYRALRADVGSFLQMVRDPEAAAEATLQPVRRFGVDAAIVFSDILMPLEVMGMELVFDSRGPSFPDPVRTARDVEALTPADPRTSLAYVGEALTRVKSELPDETALIGFCGAPFTLASYAIEGGTSRQFLELRRFMYAEPEAFGALMDKLATIVAAHLRFQVESGADVVMLFDTWAASLTAEDYRRYAMPWSKRIVDELAGVAPRIVFGGGAPHLVPEQVELGAEGVGLDHRLDIGEAFDRYGDRVALQGNLDPGVLLAGPDEVKRRARAILDAVGGRPGHILGLGHGVLKTTDPDAVAAFVETARAVTVGS